MKMASALLIAGVAVLVLISGARADWDSGDPHKMHWPQLPDPNGWDVNVQEYRLADDFLCTETGPITDVHFWVSWLDDAEGQIEEIHVSLHENIPAGQNPQGPWSIPGDVICEFDVLPAQFTYRQWHEEGDQGWLEPPTGGLENNHRKIYQVNITNIDEPDFYQEQVADPATFTISRTGNIEDALTVQYAVGGTARDADYIETLSGQIELPAGAVCEHRHHAR